MKLLSFRIDGRDGFGALTDRGVVELGTAAVPTLRAALEAIDTGTLSLDSLRDRAERAETILPQDRIDWLPPIPAPDKILCVGLNYRRHLEEVGAAAPRFPSIFVRFPGSLVGHEQPVVRPFLSEMYDFEGELAVVIGRGGRHIAAERALDHVAGYACFADHSVRDYQRHSNQATAGKNFEDSGAWGPVLTTADEIPDPAALTLVTHLNGEEVQRTGLDDLIFAIPDLIAYASSFTRLRPGDVIATGTPAGVGMARQPPRWLKAGDRVEIDIPSVGVLRNSVIDEVSHS